MAAVTRNYQSALGELLQGAAQSFLVHAQVLGYMLLAHSQATLEGLDEKVHVLIGSRQPQPPALVAVNLIVNALTHFPL